MDQIARSVYHAAESGDPVQPLLLSLYDVPYHKAKRLGMSPNNPEGKLESGVESRFNPGPLGGLFFERFVGEAVRGYLDSKFTDVRFGVNRHAVTKHPEGLPRDPDVCVERAGRIVVIEVKTSPKKPDLDYVERLRGDYEKGGITYLFCAGEISAPKGRIERLIREGWVSALDTRNKSHADLISQATVDSMLTRIHQALR
ncbi:MAG: hypothetical protein AB1752_06260 [Candidatus Zixiibacteriota bacterium]